MNPPTKADQILKDTETHMRRYQRDANDLRDEQFPNLNPNRTFLGAIHRFFNEEPRDAQARMAMNYYRDKQKDILAREYGARAVALKTGNDDVAREVGKFLRPDQEELNNIQSGYLQRIQNQYGPGHIMPQGTQLAGPLQSQMFYLNNVGVGEPPRPPL